MKPIKLRLSALSMLAAAVLALSPAALQPLPASPPAAFASQDAPIPPAQYQSMLGHGLDVDWSKTAEGRACYQTQTVTDFVAAGVRHVRIRVKDDPTPDVLANLDRQIADCLAHGLIPVLAYQADAFKTDPSDHNLEQVVNWWRTVAAHYQNQSHALSFDLLIECSDALNHQPDRLNEMIERATAAIRETNPDRIVIMSPRLRSNPAYLSELRVPTQANGYLMAEWHFYASGPSKTNEKKLWTTGTEAEQRLVRDQIQLALDWQAQTDIPTWVGAWMPGNYNDGNDYTLAEQMTFAAFLCRSLDAAGIPFAVNADTKFYDRTAGAWFAEMQPLRDLIFSPPI